MRTMFAAMLLLSLPTFAQAQQSVPREKALEMALQLCRDLPKLLDTPIPTDPDVKRPVGVHAEERGALVLPESKLRADDIAQAGAAVVPVGQLWMLRAVPRVGDQPAKAEKLKEVTIEGSHPQGKLVQCALGVRRGAAGEPELLIYGKDPQPLTSVPLTKVTVQTGNPIEVTAEPDGDGARLTLTIASRYTATLPVVLGE